MLDPLHGGNPAFGTGNSAGGLNPGDERMRLPVLTALVAATVALVSTIPLAAQGRHDDRPHGSTPATTSEPAKLPDGAVALKGGGYLVIGKDGVTYHMDKNGKRVRMRDSQVMEAVDGAKYMMKNDAIWRAITEKGTLHPSHQ
jgi:hypothetical protein